MKKKVYIVSHSHWDREWYMPYEQHHMRLIELIDDLLELFETDPSFKSFHLDGQTIILDDYLQVRPEKRAAIQKAIDEGKLQIGPFYILQDDFLISSESNTRNMLIGMEESKKWGTPVALGYFPDTFGNMGQTPQMMLQAGLESAAYGRGVKPIGFDNEVLADDNFTSQYSEMFWEGPDGSKIFGLLFANWYSNGNEIPVDEGEATIFWQQKLADVEKFGSTNHYLMMNGVDHQPVQKDISAAIRTANKLFPEYEFIHAGFTEYLEAVQQELPEDIGTITGELTSQETDGWYTLANTASSRVYLKQWNTRVSRQLENISEPLAAMAYEVTGSYDHDMLDYAWKTLMQNHPHDSICGCSLDEVHREMMPRFEKADEVGKFVADEAVRQLMLAMDTSMFPKNSKPFVIFNTVGMERSGTATVEIELERKTFKEGIPVKLYQELKERPSMSYHVVNQEGQPVKAAISTEEVLFDYELPKDAFRIPFMKRFVTVTVEISDMAEFSWEALALVEGEAQGSNKRIVSENGRVLENEQVKVVVTENGSLSISDKQTGKTLENLLVFEDVGDIANEYIFKQPEGDQAILSTAFPHSIEILENTEIVGRILLTQTLEVPKSADNLLEEEQKAVIDFRYRKAQRSKELVTFTIQTIITLDRQNKHVAFETTIDNQVKDHRLRALFPTGIHVDTHEADSIYEAVTRPNQVSSHWENPTNPQHQHAFANLHDDSFGVTISNFGLNEYEIIDDTIALTLIRCTGELGDWGWFPTPEAQCQGQHTFTYGIECHGAQKTRYQTYKHAQSLQVPFITKQLEHQTGTLAATHQFLAVDGEAFSVTALKRRKADNQLILRGYSLSSDPSDLVIQKDNCGLELLNLLEEQQEQGIAEQLQPYEIRTVGFKEEN
ncbi:glycoside hydrolase family 38 C-terminal domain-containing protein [uncultured Enterococcus sp.]|uniref:alpha-mannosidase n=1 Tax=uncultured Enterococcus sp. TaxID=167972 RepID=UPI002AA6CFE5|nr:glycoside hydrolase family 38 C-terminal domain-containing protein [uncultured Enterococcus sp.]